MAVAWLLACQPGLGVGPSPEQHLVLSSVKGGGVKQAYIHTLMAMTKDLEHRPMMVRSNAEPGLFAAKYTNCSRYCSMEGSGSSFSLLHR